MQNKTQNASLTKEEKALLKQEIKKVWHEMPLELKEFVIEAHQQRLNALYMLQDFAKKHDHETMFELLSRKIIHKEEKLKEMQTSLK